MPYAHNDQISQSPIPGGVEITQAQYLQAIDAMQDGKAISIASGFAIVERPKETQNLSAQPTIEQLKERKNVDINDWRMNANYSTFPHQNKIFACDQLSRSDIDAVANCIALTGGFPPDFPGVWKATDNSYIEMQTVESFKAFYQSMTAQGTANFNRAQQLKAALIAASSAEEIAAIVWGEA